MTFLGKILTVVNFVFSLVLMSLALMVGAMHKNWYDFVNNPADKATAAKPLGLVHQLENAKKRNQQVQDENDRLHRQIESERVARRVEVAKLESARQNLSNEHQALEAQHQKEVDALGSANAALAAAEKALTDKQKELDGLRTEIRLAQEERDKTLLQVTDVADKNHQLALAIENMRRRGVELGEQIAQYKNVLAAYNLDANSDISGIPPPLEGKITNVRSNGQEITLVVSVGKDDGLREGNEMNVFRGNDLIGRIRIVRVDPDRSVGESDPVYYKRPFQVGDEARTIVPRASLDRQADKRAR